LLGSSYPRPSPFYSAANEHTRLKNEHTGKWTERGAGGCASLAHLDLSEMEGKITAAAHTTTTSTDTRTRTVEAVMKIVTELRKKHQPRVDSSTDRVSTVGLVLEAGCHISAVCS
jgi:hypothetical protein